MKLYILFVLLLINTNTFSQGPWETKANKEIVTKETDKFTGQSRMKSKEVRLVWSVKKGALLANLRSVDSTTFIIFTGTIGYGVIGEKDELIVLFDDNSKISLFPTGIQDYNSLNQKYTHQYYISIDQIKELANKNISAVRKYTVSGYSDIDIEPKYQGNLKQIALEFITNMK